MDLIAFSDRKDTVPYFTRIMITPGDSIHMDVKNGKIEFLGKNKAHYNFFLEMNDPLRGFLREFAKTVLLAFFIPQIWLLFDKKNQNLYDKFFDTVVVKADKDAE